MARKPRVHFAGTLYHMMCQGNQGQSIFKELAKSYTGVLSRRFRKAGRGVGERTGVGWCRGNALRQLEEGKAAQNIDKVCLAPKS
jgi:hypothetical protein